VNGAAEMTREVQKVVERQTLDVLLASLGLRLDQEPEASETPDFMVSLSGQRIGVEITMYSSRDTVDGGRGRRQVESEWEKLRLASEAFRAARPELRDVNVNLMFGGPVPPQRQHADFMEEIAAFVGAHRHELRSDDIDYWPPSFSAPLMSTYLQTLYLRAGPFAEWHSNLAAGFVATPATSTIAEIVAGKSGRQFRRADELWLAIQCSTRISETLLPVGTTDFDSIPPLDDYRFSRVFVMTFLGVHQWKKGEGWRKLTGEPDQQFSNVAILSAQKG
jgi:hypothetical protein